MHPIKKRANICRSLIASIMLLGITSLSADVTIDGDLSDWDLLERINLPADLPPYLDDGEAVYGKYDPASEAYAFAIGTKGTQIGANTTFWLNTDNDTATGFQIFGAYGGAEYFVNIFSGDNKPYLYKSDGTFVTGPLEYRYSADKTVLEFLVPVSYLDNPAETIGVMGDINDNIFFPKYYSQGSLYVTRKPLNLPKRTDFSKRVAIVYSESSKAHFYDVNLPVQKAYSQLFMAMQYQAMMAGIPYDMLSEDDLTDISKLVNYDAIIFPYFAYVPKDKIDAIHDTLYKAVYHYGIGIVTAGDWMTNLSDGSAISGDSYRNMKQILGVGRVSGAGPAAITLKAKDTSHTAMDRYQYGETIIDYAQNHWFNYFTPVSNTLGQKQPVSVLATQTVKSDDMSGTYDAILADKTGGRNIHFSSIEFMADTNVLWSALQWVVYGDSEPVALRMGRYQNLFVARIDMDQSQEIDEVKENDGALYDIIKGWKKKYNYTGSYYINIGNNPPDQQTDWSYSGPLYKKYIKLGSEIGTHSYTHPHNTNELTDDQIKFEFDDSMNIIAAHLNPTWRGENIRGCAVPGAPEGLDTAHKILQYVDYLSGGYSGMGAGYPGAFGYLTPSDRKVYLSPNMAFDFTLIEFGVPVWDASTQKYVPVPLSPDDATQYWLDEYAQINRHASLPIVHWPWHDYGPTTGVTSGAYSKSMFTTLLKTAYKDRAEFLTGIDLVQRIEAFHKAKITTTDNGDTIDVHVDAQNVGKFALAPKLPAGKVISRVDNWYAYNRTKLFLDQDGGDFTIHAGDRAERVTHLTHLPMRAKLLSVNGDGTNLSFSFEGEGVVTIRTKGRAKKYRVRSSDKVKVRAKKSALKLYFKKYGKHSVSIRRR